MNGESYTETLYHIQKKNTDDTILTLKRFTNNTKNIGTMLKPMSYYEDFEDGLIGNKLLDVNTGEVIVQWDKNNVIYVCNDYNVLMEQEHTLVTDEHMCKLHNDYINYTI